LANRLVRDGVPFRTAHHTVGTAVRRAVECGQPTIACLELPDGTTVNLTEGNHTDGLSLDAVVAALDRGGGPGAFDDGFAPAHQAWSDQQSWFRDQRNRLRRAGRELIEAVDRVLAPGD
jgi:argininosuccinate lyase